MREGKNMEYRELNNKAKGKEQLSKFTTEHKNPKQRSEQNKTKPKTITKTQIMTVCTFSGQNFSTFQTGESIEKNF